MSVVDTKRVWSCTDCGEPSVPDDNPEEDDHFCDLCTARINATYELEKAQNAVEYLTAERDSLRARVAELEAERDRLRAKVARYEAALRGILASASPMSSTVCRAIADIARAALAAEEERR